MRKNINEIAVISPEAFLSSKRQLWKKTKLAQG